VSGWRHLAIGVDQLLDLAADDKLRTKLCKDSALFGTKWSWE